MYPSFNTILYFPLSDERIMIMKKQNKLEHSPGKKCSTFQTFLPTYWAISRGGKHSDRYLSLSNFQNILTVFNRSSTSAQFQTYLMTQHKATIPMSYFINNQNYNLQDCTVSLFHPVFKLNSWALKPGKVWMTVVHRSFIQPLCAQIFWYGL